MANDRPSDTKTFPTPYRSPYRPCDRGHVWVWQLIAQETPRHSRLHIKAHTDRATEGIYGYGNWSPCSAREAKEEHPDSVILLGFLTSLGSHYAIPHLENFVRSIEQILKEFVTISQYLYLSTIIPTWIWILRFQRRSIPSPTEAHIWSPRQSMQWEQGYS